MILDTTLLSPSLAGMPEIARAAEQIGFDTLWLSETQHDPFLPAALIAEHTRRLGFGTAVAISFARSPATLAYTAWDLAAHSGGRFVLGLGTQVKAHIERRFGMIWPASPVGKLREQLAAIRSFWRTWQTGTALNFRGAYYKLTLMSPFFNPGPIEHPEIPIFIAGVNIGLAQLAGEMADGFHAHPFNSPRYLRQVLLPAIQKGLAKSGRSRGAVQVSLPVFVVTSPAEREFVRQQIAFYASTPSYRPVMALHGWGTVAGSLSTLAARRRWAEMPALISDQMLREFATFAEPGELAPALQERYQGLVDRISLYTPFVPGEKDDFWRNLVGALKEPGE